MVPEPASRVLHRHLRRMASCLAVADPQEDLAEAIDGGFELPIEDESYGRNALQPGALAFEWSFSEAARASLRVDFEPCGPRASAIDRQADATRLVRNMITRRGGGTDLAAFDRACEPWRAMPGIRFGAFLGATIGARGLDEVKIYYETTDWNPGALPPRVREVVGIARATLPGLSPLLYSIAWSLSDVAARVYLVCREDLRLLDLMECLRAAGLEHRTADLLITARALGGGTLVLPGATAVLSLREAADGLEVKLELVASALPRRQAALRQTMRALLGQRPESLLAFTRWLEAASVGQPGTMSVASIRVAPSASSRLSVYLRLTAEQLAGACSGALAS